MIICKKIWEMTCHNMIIVTLMLFLITGSLIMTGILVKKQEKSQENADRFEEEYGENQYYWVTEALDDRQYYTYLEGDYNGTQYKGLVNVLQSLWDEKQFSFCTCCCQSFCTNSKMQDIFLEGYEDGYADFAVSKRNGTDWYEVKTLMVSEKFFEINHINVKSGEKFSQQDYLWKEGEIVPVLLGKSYENFYHINDVFSGEYFGKELTLKVIGFLDDNSFYLSSSKNDFVSVERYMVLPALEIEEKTEFSQLLSLMELNGTIVSKTGFQNTGGICTELIENQGLKWELNLHNPQDESPQFVVKKYRKMTGQVAEQFRILVLLVMVFAIIALLINSFSILKKNQYAFGVELLCGASYKNILMEGAGFIFFILFTGDLWAVLFLLAMNSGIRSIILIQIIVGTASVITLICCIVYMKKMEIGDIIGGQE